MALTDRQLAFAEKLEAAWAPRLADTLTAYSRSLLREFRLTRLMAVPEAGHSLELRLSLRELWTQAVSASADAFIKEFAEGFPTEKKATSDILDRFINEMRPRVADQILQTSQRQIQDMLAGGMAAGEAADVVYADLLDRLPDLSFLRALLITRTEVHAATQFTSWRLALQSSVPLVKVWNSTPDEKTRDFTHNSTFNHRAMNGQRRGLTEFFSVPRFGGGAEEIMFPGDPLGSAGNVINCRCTQEYMRA